MRAFAALFERMLRREVRQVVVWGLALGALGALEVAIFPSLDTSQFDRLLRSYPPELLKVFRIARASDLSTIEGFLAVELFTLIVPLALAFFPVFASAAAIAGAEERGALEVLLGNPLPRPLLVAASFASTAVSLLGILVILGLVLWVTGQAFGAGLTVAATVRAMLGLWPLCIFFGGLALLLSALFHRRSVVAGVAAIVVVGMYMVDVLSSFSDAIDKVRPLSVFDYYGSAIQDGIAWGDFAGVAVAALAWVGLAALAFQRREITG